MSSLDIVDVGKSFGDTHVLHNIKVEIFAGEFVVLVGPSGCGKSTLLRVIAGLEDASSGRVLIDNEVVNDVHPKNRDIAMVFQNYGLYPHMTAAQNMGFALKLQGERKEDIQQKIGSAADILGLVDLLDRYPRQLSGGQRQRVAMGRAIVRKPKVFLFDEPLSNLDAKLRVQMRSEIRALHKRLEATTVYVTHDQIEAMTMADKIVAMLDGRVMQIGSPLDLYDRPENTFVASFIGSPSMNLLNAKLDNNRIALQGSDYHIPIETTENPVEKTVTLGIRPEDFVVAEDGFEVSVGSVEHTGSETYVFCRLGEQSVTVLLKERTSLDPGQSMTIAPRNGRIHLFEQASGNRLNR